MTGMVFIDVTVYGYPGAALMHGMADAPSALAGRALFYTAPHFPPGLVRLDVNGCLIVPHAKLPEYLASKGWRGMLRTFAQAVWLRVGWRKVRAARYAEVSKHE